MSTSLISTRQLCTENVTPFNLPIEIVDIVLTNLDTVSLLASRSINSTFKTLVQTQPRYIRMKALEQAYLIARSLGWENSLKQKFLIQVAKVCAVINMQKADSIFNEAMKINNEDNLEECYKRKDFINDNYIVILNQINALRERNLKTSLKILEDRIQSFDQTYNSTAIYRFLLYQAAFDSTRALKNIKLLNNSSLDLAQVCKTIAEETHHFETARKAIDLIPSLYGENKLLALLSLRKNDDQGYSESEEYIQELIQAFNRFINVKFTELFETLSKMYFIRKKLFNRLLEGLIDSDIKLLILCKLAKFAWQKFSKDLCHLAINQAQSSSNQHQMLYVLSRTAKIQVIWDPEKAKSTIKLATNLLSQLAEDAPASYAIRVRMAVFTLKPTVENGVQLSESERDRVFHSLIKKYVYADFEKAKSAVESIVEPHLKLQSYAWFLSHLFNWIPNDAMVLIKNLPIKYYDCLIDNINEISQIDFEKAKQLIENMSAKSKDRAMVELAKTRARKHPKLAMTFLESISTNENKIELLLDIAKYLEVQD